VKTSRSLTAALAVALCLATPASAWAGHLLDDSGNDNQHTHGSPGTATSHSAAPTATQTPAATPASGSGNGNPGTGNGTSANGKGNGTPATGNGNGTPATGSGDHSGADHGPGDPATPTLPPNAAPVAGERVAATPASGVVTVLLPGTDTAVPLDQAASMPVGSRIDARAGTVVLHAALPGIGNEAGTFSGAEFIVRQDTRHHITELRLVGGDFGKCAERSLASTHHGTKKVVRSLWGSDHGGHFRTHGHNSVATVRGTRWLTEDRCDGTLTKVTQGAVSVHDRRAHRTVVVQAGHSYLARRHPR
jgi:hypothetical protein